MMQSNINMTYTIRAKDLRNRAYIIVLMCFLFMQAFGQEPIKVIPQYSFSQVDSLAKNIMDNISIDGSSFTVINTQKLIGSYSRPNGKFAAHENHFDTYVLYSQRHRFYIQKVDNFGYFKKRHVKGQEVEEFLMRFYNNMNKEILYPKIDTIYDNRGTFIAATTTKDHQAVRVIEIIKAQDTLRYEYPSSFSANKSNEDKYRVRFLSIIDNPIKQYNKKKRKRLSVVFGYDRELQY